MTLTSTPRERLVTSFRRSKVVCDRLEVSNLVEWYFDRWMRTPTRRKRVELADQISDVCPAKRGTASDPAKVAPWHEAHFIFAIRFPRNATLVGSVTC
jgi:hypothetical protein